MFSDQLTSLLIDYHLPAIFLGAFFFGETVIISAAVLAAKGYWSLWVVFWFSLIGTIASDCIWFYCGQAIFRLTHRWEKHRPKYERILAALEKLTGKRPFLSLLFIKFLYGTRVLIIMYLSVRRLPFWLFFVFNTIGTAVWLMVILTLGWLTSTQLLDAFPIFNKIQYLLLALLVLILLIRFISIWLRKKLIHE